MISNSKIKDCHFPLRIFSLKHIGTKSILARDRIDLTEEKINLEEDGFLKRQGEADAWILKPVFANCGIGIKICTNTKKLKQEIVR